jgi:glycosyltransferase involved in cell wall biosynthesis
MRILVVGTTRRRAWSDLAVDCALRAHDGAEVVRVWADGRLPVDPPRPGLELVGRTLAGVRYVDAVLGAGERDAAWLGLPWWLAEGAGDRPIAVIDDTLLLGAPLEDLVKRAGDEATAVVRARRSSGGSGWGGGLPGLLVLPRGPGAAAGLWAWWRDRAGELLRDGSPGSGTPGRGLWSSLPIGSDTVMVGAPVWRLSAATAPEIRLDADEAPPVRDGDPATAVHTHSIGGEALGAFDLAGFDPARPWWFAAPDDGSHCSLVGRPGLRGLLRWVVRELNGRGGTGAGSSGPVPGIVVDESLRRWYRSVLGSGADLPPNPFVVGEVAPFLDLLAAAGRAGGPTVDGDLVLERRPDVRDAFVAGGRAGGDALVRWMWTHGLREGSASLAVLPDLPVPPTPSHGRGGRRPSGVNVIGYLDGELGLGVAARRMVDALEAAGVSVSTVTYGRTSSRRRGAGIGSGAGRPDPAPFDTNLLVITPDQLPLFVRDVGPALMENRRNVGLWFWETDVLPASHLASFDLVDEVWAPTEYLREVFTRCGRVPVAHVPVPLTFDAPGDVDRSAVGLDDRFTVLFSFDFLSVADRKNPEGLVEAYELAFPDGDGTRLVLKCINGELFPERLARLEDRTADRADIDVRDEYVSGRERLALVAAADCYASLHRSEGLGLTMAEAMSVGTPVVATAYSGNLDFMDDGCALMVPAREVVIGPGHHYPAEGHWAEPDLEVAAGHLRRLREEPDLRRRLSGAGRARIARHGVDAAATAVRRALAHHGATPG